MRVHPLIRRARTVYRRMPNGATQENIETSTTHNAKSQVNPAGQDDLTLSYTNSEPPREQMPDEHAQRGVQDVEAVALTWSQGYLIAVFVKYVSITGRIFRYEF